MRIENSREIVARIADIPHSTLDRLLIYNIYVPIIIFHESILCENSFTGPEPETSLAKTILASRTTLINNNVRIFFLSSYHIVKILFLTTIIIIYKHIIKWHNVIL